MKKNANANSVPPCAPESKPEGGMGTGQRQAVVEVCGWIMTEIGAGKALTLPGRESIEQIVWNNAHERCLTIVQSYRDGCGLFQMTEGLKPRLSDSQTPTGEHTGAQGGKDK